MEIYVAAALMIALLVVVWAAYNPLWWVYAVIPPTLILISVAGVAASVTLFPRY